MCFLIQGIHTLHICWLENKIPDHLYWTFFQFKWWSWAFLLRLIPYKPDDLDQVPKYVYLWSPRVWSRSRNNLYFNESKHRKKLQLFKQSNSAAYDRNRIQCLILFFPYLRIWMARCIASTPHRNTTQCEKHDYDY